VSSEQNLWSISFFAIHALNMIYPSSNRLLLVIILRASTSFLRALFLVIHVLLPRCSLCSPARTLFFDSTSFDLCAILIFVLRTSFFDINNYVSCSFTPFARLKFEIATLAVVLGKCGSVHTCTRIIHNHIVYWHAELRVPFAPEMPQ
jgi:hypothetical protein